jgi:hypothetical protein
VFFLSYEKIHSSYTEMKLTVKSSYYLEGLFHADKKLLPSFFCVPLLLKWT